MVLLFVQAKRPTEGQIGDLLELGIETSVGKGHSNLHSGKEVLREELLCLEGDEGG